jgi:ABC-type lipopolysaccharide export system ATPase subunit
VTSGVGSRVNGTPDQAVGLLAPNGASKPTIRRTAQL